MQKMNRSELLKQMESVLPGLSQREVIEQSSCFVFCKGKVITYNDEVMCTQKCDLKIDCAVFAKPFISILRKLTDDEISVSTNKTELVIGSIGTNASVHLEKEILLPVADVEKPQSWKLLPKDFCNAIADARSCASTDASHFVLTCIHIHPKWVEACDGVQAIRYTIKTNFNSPALITRSAIKHVLKSEVSEFSETKNWIHFRNESGIVYSCRRYTEEYPDLTGELKCEGAEVTLPKELLRAVGQAEVFASKFFFGSYVTVKLQSGRAVVMSYSASGHFSGAKTIAYKGKTIQFTIEPTVLKNILRKYSRFEVASSRLKVDGGKFVYVTCSGTASDMLKHHKITN
ncbi:MAG: hypothetical protein A2Y12_03985 [Planctomycetes bacterium GWF2_42_9]|nr:MAG: hypothetical protein A2Y12_03985 [Planctomycetes bacterium GWF2_42_9]